MHFLAAAILTLATAANALKIPSFAPPDFPVSDIDNDGTHAGRYDVRKTMVWLDDKNPENLNSYFYLFWLTTVDGRKYHTTLAPNFFRGRTTGIFRVEDLQDLSSTGATVFAPGTGSSEYLNLRSEIQNLTSPRGGDNYTAMHVTSDYAGVKLDVHMTPTGKNLYIGGNGGVTLSSPGNDFRELVPGYSWYWGNPTLRLSGTINIDGKDVEIDHGKSRGYFERQSGEFGISGGHWGYWLYLSNGIFIHGWVVGATVERPYSTPAWATVWHPNGIHEILEVGNTTTATDVWKSPVSGKNYFQNFKLDLPSREASFHIHQAIKKSELRPLPGSDGYQITEAYSQGHGVWEGEKVTFYGHTEQLSYW
ncbi:hypothetical protein FOQG_16865 [Fusarium oxysporum f. sp. raphani 54005]|uniref:AttH domain-containing protein n=4 Tax=Fusarium oxysporum TaxID=5507 RepID=X0B9L3_FUSOX|nr:hypothetical protein FOQG_16865 [Fusarium oxysporum f. sp. raphani 54005]EXL67459.1 hypothetical protein FOPG_16422 [Fusarium oxysporum f. sp. conglutinans race 2 54008]KAG7418635.1 hypothetical protein Forpi1262_v016512 [Fusarium oxysporum f. sp. raphani]